VTRDGQKSRPHRLKNGVPQCSVVAPTLYNIYRYTSHFPTTVADRYIVHACRWHCSDYCCPYIQAGSRHPLSWYEYCTKFPKTVEVKTVKKQLFHLPSISVTTKLTNN